MTIEFLDKPLTLERVQAAYTKAKAKPAHGIYFSQPHQVRRCCALGAVAVAEGAVEFGDTPALEPLVPSGFLAGYDQIGACHPDYLEGYRLGARIRKALFPQDDWVEETP